MEFNELKELLFQENEIEVFQLETGKNVNDQNLPYGEVKIPDMPSKVFFNEGNIFISKHHRYSAMPNHRHEFVEFNYMLSGECIQFVNEERVHLREGEILLMDRNTTHRIDSLGQNDILINILLKNESINTDIIVNMAKSHSLINNFLINAYNQYNRDANYFYLKTSENYNVQHIIRSLMLEYYNKDRYYIRTMNIFLSLLLIELTRFIEKDSEQNITEDEEIIGILRYIERNFRSLKLSDLAKTFGYNTNYLSNKLKKVTGHSFQELLNDIRYQKAEELLIETDYSLEEIAYNIGFESSSSLYKLFFKYGNKSPNEIRKLIKDD